MYLYAMLQCNNVLYSESMRGLELRESKSLLKTQMIIFECVQHTGQRPVTLSYYPVPWGWVTGVHVYFLLKEIEVCEQKSDGG